MVDNLIEGFVLGFLSIAVFVLSVRYNGKRK